MLAITPEAAAYVKEKQKPIHLELPPEIGCCIHLREKPAFAWARPMIRKIMRSLCCKELRRLYPKSWCRFL